MWWDRRHARLPLFIVYSYIAGLAINHWFGALVHISLTDASASSVDTPDGFALSTWGLVFLVAGAAAFPAVRFVNAKLRRPIGARDPSHNARRAINIILLLGIACWIAELSPVARVPSLGAAISGGKELLIAGICLKCWLAWNAGESRRLLLWLSIGFALPLYTMLVLGFLGYGITYLSCILIFVGTFYRPRWRVFAAGLIAIYAGLSVYVAYVENRVEIRDAVWGGRSMEDRFDAAMKMMNDIVPFDPSNPDHKRLVDLRLNQNYLVGASMQYVPEMQPFVEGETLYIALIGLIPRAIWPGKPETGGSGNLVTDFTGIRFAEGTSVGIGQVMEFYVNFGWTGVAVGFFLFGFGLRFVDLLVSISIRDQEWSKAGLWFAVGLSAIQPIGQLVEVTTSMAAAAVFGIMAHKLSQTSWGGRGAGPLSGAVRADGSMPLIRSLPLRGDRPVDRPERNVL